MKKIQSNTSPFGSGKWFWLSKMAWAAVAGESGNSAVHLQKKVCNKYDLTAAQCF
jgi:hypothetical protein